jgi:hypothetical protein
MRPPRALGLIPCREFVVNAGQASYTLEGVFHALYFDAWPAVAPPFLVFAALTGGRGEGTMELTVVQTETEVEVFRWSQWTAFADPDVVHAHQVRVRRCVFPTPGRYTFTLRFDGREIDNRVIDVFQTRG